MFRIGVWTIGFELSILRQTFWISGKEVMIFGNVFSIFKKLMSRRGVCSFSENMGDGSGLYGVVVALGTYVIIAAFKSISICFWRTSCTAANKCFVLAIFFPFSFCMRCLKLSLHLSSNFILCRSFIHFLQFILQHRSWCS